MHLRAVLPSLSCDKRKSVAESERNAMKSTTGKKKLKLCILLGIIVIAAVAAALIIRTVRIKRFVNTRLDYYYSEAADSYDIIDISMTEEERLADFKAAYEYAVLSSPSTPEIEELYGIDFEKLYEEYCGYIRECQNDFDYIFLLYSFLETFPSGHAYVTVPSPENLRKTGFQMTENWGNTDMEDEYLYSWQQYLYSVFEEYDIDDTPLHTYDYIDGEYILRYTEGAEEYGDVLTAIDGRSPMDYTFDSPCFNTLAYDENHGVAYRTKIQLNDRFGRKVTVTLRDMNGETREETAYIDEKFNFVTRLRNAYSKGEAIGYKDTTQKQYTITEDDKYNLVYIQIRACTGYMDDFTSELSSALEGHDNVIIDLRGNDGGLAIYCEEYLYPLLFTDDLEFDNHFIVGNNDNTLSWAKETYIRDNYNSRISRDGTIEFSEHSHYIGKADKDYRIFVITDNETFSSADHITAVLGMKENVTIVGSNTSGEGISGMIFTSLLPNSRLVIAYTPCYNTNISPANSVYGTPVDIIRPTTGEEIRLKYSKMAAGIDCESYENRLLWDGTLNEVIEMI